MTHPVAFVDTETTGLDADFHQIWEVGLITPDGAEHHWFLPVDLGRADPIALRIGRFHDRHPHGHDFQSTVWDEEKQRSYWVSNYVSPLDEFARQFARLTRGLHLAGAVVSFDEERLRQVLKANGACPEWHYHIIDVEPLAIGYLSANYAGGRWWTPALVGDEPHVKPPWKSDELTSALGLTVNEADKHTALGDARWAEAIYRRVMEDD